MRTALLTLLTLLTLATTSFAGADASWEHDAQANLAAMRSHFSVASDGAARATNVMQDIRATVTGDGFRMASRTRGGAGFEVGFRLAGFGRDDAMRGTPPGPVEVVASRAEVTRANGLTEWFVNEARGFEHGYTVATRPGGASDREVVLALELDTRLEVRAHVDGRTIAFGEPGDAPAMRYTDLHVLDAEGEVLPSRFVQNGSSLEIRYDDRDATYPVVVDPLTTTTWWGVEGTGAYDLLGRSVQAAGDVNGDGYSDVMIGIPQEDESAGDAGAVWVYYGSASGLPSQYTPSWVRNGNLFAGNFGWSAAPLGDVNGDGFADIIVGQPRAGSGQRAYVHLGSATGLKTTIGNLGAAEDWKASGTGTWNGTNGFGWSVGGAGDVNGDGFEDVIVGAPLYSASALAADQSVGACYIWLGRANFGDPALGTSDDGTPANAAFAYFGGGAQRRVGWAVSGVGDVNGDGYDDVIVGEPGFSGNGGRVQLLTGQPTATGVNFADAINGVAGSALGHSVGAAGDVNGDGFADVLVGAPAFNGGRGAVYLFVGRATFPYLTQLRVWTGTTPGDSLGLAVHTAGDVNGDGFADVVIGRGVYQFNGTDPGAAWFFYGSPSGPGTTPDWSVTGPIYNTINRSSAYGFSVAAVGDVDGDGFGEFIVGAPHYGQSEWGYAYVYKGDARTPVAATLTAAGLTTEDVVGWSTNIVGDVNDDGYDDVLVGSPGWTNTLTDQGAAFLYYGNATGVQTTPGWVQYGQFAGAGFGVAVGAAGDVNNDGYADLIVGAHINAGQGGAYVWHGGPSGPSTGAANWENSSSNSGSQYGYWVGRAGDVNGDGYGDVIIGAGNEDAGMGVGQGCAYVYLGGAGGLSNMHAWRRCGEEPGAMFGQVVSTAGDVNADGLDDIIVGAYGMDINGTDRGRAYIYNGIATGVRNTPLWTKDGPSAGAAFGQTVSTAGDVNGDGYSDVLIGAPGHASQGRVELYFGGYNGPGQTPGWFKDSGQFFSGFGAALNTPGDVTGDGFSDLLVGAVFWDGTGGQDCGRVFLYPGGPAGPAATESWFADGVQPFSNLGHMVGGGGDVNDDGFPDIVLGEPGHSGVAFRTGRAQMFLGNGPGARRVLMQIQDCSTLCIFRGVSPQGRAAQPGFTPAIRDHSPAGRDILRSQTELETRGRPFDGIGVVTSPPLLSTGFGLLGQPMSCPPGQDPCHWRIRTSSRNPWFPRSPWFSLPHNGPTESDVRMAGPVLAVDPSGPTPGMLALAPSPNPSAGATRFAYALPASGMARLVVRDVAGRLVRTLVNRWHEAGRYEIVWDANDERGGPTPPGVYIAVVESGEGRTSTQFSLVR